MQGGNNRHQKGLERWADPAISRGYTVYCISMEQRAMEHLLLPFSPFPCRVRCLSQVLLLLWTRASSCSPPSAVGRPGPWGSALQPSLRHLLQWQQLPCRQPAQRHCPVGSARQVWGDGSRYSRASRLRCRRHGAVVSLTTWAMGVSSAAEPPLTNAVTAAATVLSVGGQQTKTDVSDRCRDQTLLHQDHPLEVPDG